MKHYNLILFDFDNTLVCFDTVQRLSLLQACEDVAPELLKLTDLCDTFKKLSHETWRDMERGTLPRGELPVERFRRLRRATGIELDPERLSQVYMEELLIHPAPLIEGADQLIRKLRGRCPLGIVTNGFAQVQRTRWERFPLKSSFDFIVISEETPWKKPDPEIFAFARQQVFPEVSSFDTLMVGDRLLADVLGAARAGMDTCWFNPHGEPGSCEVRPTIEVRSLIELDRLFG